MSAHAPVTASELCTVIVPVYAHEAYLEACLDSVAAQTHPALELVIVDDASPDNSHAVAQQWLNRPEVRTRFVRTELWRQPHNQGAHAALNLGLSRAQGTWIAILNSDDAYVPTRLERLIGALQQQQRDFGFSLVQPLNEANTGAHRGFWQLLHFIEQVVPHLPGVSFACLAHNCAITTGNFVLRRTLAQQLGEFEALILAHDWDYLLRACTVTEPLLLPEPLYHYRLHPSNTFGRVDQRSAVEREVCVGRYFQRVATATLRNPLAPSPENWPGLFEHFVWRWGWLPLWQRLYTPEQRYAQALNSAPSTPQPA